MGEYSLIMTNKGLAKEAAAHANGTAVNLTQFALGDGNGAFYTPDATQTALKHEVKRIDIKSRTINPNNAAQLILEGYLAANVTGFEIREIGIYDGDGELFAVGKHPYVNKLDASSGAVSELYIKQYFTVTNTANFTLNVDGSGMFVLKAGDTMTGNLTLPAGTESGHAVNKGQMDTAISAHASNTNAHPDIRTLINTETTRAESAEGSLQTAISAETTRAENIEVTKADKVANATTTDVAILDANGNLKDGGFSIDDTKRTAKNLISAALVASMFLTPNSVNAGAVDSSNNPKVLSAPGSGQKVNVSLPTFASATEAASGKNGITVTPSAAYAIVGLNTYNLGGYDVTASCDFHIYIDLGQERALKQFSYFIGGRNGISYNACFSSIWGSNDNTNWTKIFTSPSGNSPINFSGQAISGTYRYINFGIEKQANSGDSYPMGIGGINLMYEDTTSSATGVYLNAGGDYPALTLTDYLRNSATLNNTSNISIPTTNLNALYNLFVGLDGKMEAYTQAQFGKDFYCDFSQGCAADNYGLHQVMTAGNPTYANNKFNSNGNTGQTVLITTLGNGSWCVQGQFKNSASQCRIFNGNITYQGLCLHLSTDNKLKLYLSSSNTSYDIANAISGIKSDWSSSLEYFIRARFDVVLGKYYVDWSTDYNPNTGIGTWTNDITVPSTSKVYSNISAINFGCDTGAPIVGTMGALQVTIGDSVCRRRNKYVVGKVDLYPFEGDYLYNTSVEPAVMQKYTSGAYVSASKIPCGQCTTDSNGNTASVIQPRFNQNGYNINSKTVKKYDSGWFPVVANTLYTKTHNLGTSQIRYIVLIADDMNGTNCRPAYDLYSNGSYYLSWAAGATTNTTLSISTKSYIGDTLNSVDHLTSGFYRIIAEAL